MTSITWHVCMRVLSLWENYDAGSSVKSNSIASFSNKIITLNAADIAYAVNARATTY